MSVLSMKLKTGNWLKFPVLSAHRSEEPNHCACLGVCPRNSTHDLLEQYLTGAQAPVKASTLIRWRVNTNHRTPNMPTEAAIPNAQPG